MAASSTCGRVHSCVCVIFRRPTHSLHKHEPPSKVTLYHPPVLLKAPAPRSPRSLITVLIMLPGNNMHFISFPPSVSIVHATTAPSLLPFPCHRPLCCISRCLFLSPFLSSLPPADLQSCLICVARRVPMKERPMLPAHESFTTRQDLQGTTRKTEALACLNPKHFSAEDRVLRLFTESNRTDLKAFFV